MKKTALLLISLLVVFALALSACAPKPPVAEPPVVEEPAVEAPAVEEPAAAVDPMAELVAAAQKEGNLTVIALPGDWCNYEEAIDTFKAK